MEETEEMPKKLMAGESKLIMLRFVWKGKNGCIRTCPEGPPWLKASGE